MDKILVSSCLLGRPVRYDGRAKTVNSDFLKIWQAEGRLVPVCPEVLGGLPTPRPPAEIVGGRIVDTTGTDVTEAFERGADAAFKLALGCKFALLTDGSPSCGSGVIYDGSFSGQKIAGTGLTTALLRQNGIQVFAESEIDRLAEAIRA